PYAELAAISSVSFEGKTLPEVYPSMAKRISLTLGCEDEVIGSCDVVFASLPHGLSQETAARCDRAGKLFIDLGADFRLESEEDYKEWYGGEFADKGLHHKAVYGIPELFREEIRGKSLIANPGCYPTSAALGLAPLLKGRLIETNSIVIDSKSGVTGAGRGLTQTTHFPDCNEAFSPYKVASHRHTPEIEQTLSRLSGEKLTVTFVPHLLPINRGILSTIYASANKPLTLEELHALYLEFYKDEPFVRIMPAGEAVNVRNVRCSNYCDISLHFDKRTGRAIVASVIDNMVKGAAGQAIQNMNLCRGLPETSGLEMIPPAF
ncbi:MAG: N-acetyl-gamma-glutamyl-phosphate reductase, partial [Oscillospiraceae bacterium]|nr:N-acetyl-gamma-glutamyl-phosphate reductase [Oscillospiraceae bacterium]